MKKTSIFTAAVVLLSVMMLIVSCGEDPFFHHLTIKDDDGKTVKTIILESGDYELPKEVEGLENILGWIYEDEEYSVGEKISITKDSEIKSITGIIISIDNGDGTTQKMTVKNGNTTITLPKAPAERSGFVFDGWLVNGTLREASAVVDFSADMTIEAKWTPTHTVTVDNGDDTTQPLVVRDGETTVTLPAAPAERDGFVFDGWLVNGTLREASAVVDFSTDMTVEAKWTAIYTITYDANGGTGTISPAILRDDQSSVKLSDGKGFSNGTLTFSGWNTRTDEKGTSYKSGANYSEKANVTLYAVWRNEITVSFNSDGGTSVNSQTIVGGTTATKPSTPGKKNAVFQYWSLDGTSEFNFKTTLDADTELKAVWKTTFVAGDKGPAGGYIVYVNSTGAGGWTYLEAKSSDKGDYEWGPKRNLGAVSYNPGDGYSNTNTAYNAMTTDEQAKTWAIKTVKLETVKVNGIKYEDWFLPCSGDLQKLYDLQLKDSNGNAVYSKTSYWSSTENASNSEQAYSVSFTTGTATPQGKGVSDFVLPFRRF